MKVKMLGFAIGTLLVTNSVVPTMAAADSHVNVSTPSVQNAKTPDFDPWLQQPVLGYLFQTQDEKLGSDKTSLKTTLGLSDADFESIAQIAQEETYLLKNMKSQSDKDLTGKSLSEQKQIVTNSGYNNNMAGVLKNSDAAIHKLLGGKYSQFRTWLFDWWNNERNYRNSQIAKPGATNGGGGTYYTIYATQYNAYTTYEVALPDKNLKASGNYSITINRNSAYTTQYVKEVGPWNEDDDYWDPNYVRRMFMTLSQYDPEAYEAYTNHYNYGQDQFGRTVTNPAGIDLSPAVASTLGMGTNVSAYVQVNFVGLP